MTDAEIPPTVSNTAAAGVVPTGVARAAAVDAGASPPHPRLDELIATLARLRAPGGCVWDREQTHESLVRYLLEETHELVDAIEAGTRAELIEELGDVLYQVIFHADIAAHAPNPTDRFDLEDVSLHMTEKMIGRHPHVFAHQTANTADDVIAIWDDVKRVEKSYRTSVLDGVPTGMPSLLLADKLLGKAEKLGVGVPSAGRPGEAGAGAAVAGLAEAATPLTAEADATEADAAEARLGAQLLTLVASARLDGLDAERALRSALRGLATSIRSVEADTQAPQARDSGE